MNHFFSHLVLTLVLMGCSQTKLVGDRRLKKDEIPSFLLPLKDSRPGVKFYEKITHDHRRTYEAKHEEKGFEISESFDTSGELIEREEDIEFRSLAGDLQKKIKEYLANEYPRHKILEVEKRTSLDRSFIDVEIRHDSSESGYWEISFDSQGNYVSREIENYDQPMTHN